MSQVISYQTHDRLSFTLFVAILVHALLIFGVTFNLAINKQQSPTLEITLATHQSDMAPDNADFLAQFNQAGSGTADEAKQLTTEHVAEFADTQIRQTNQSSVARSQPEDTSQVLLTSTGAARQSVAKEPKVNPQEEQPVQGDSETTVSASDQIASLKAKLDRQREAYAKKPRIRRLTSVAARASEDAAYLYQWSQKVEFVGNRNFPAQALADGINGKLRLLAVVDKDGTLLSAEILESSGHRVLDDAAIQIVHLSSPFPAFPKSIKANTDQLEIIRTWNFEVSGLSTGL